MTIFLSRSLTIKSGVHSSFMSPYPVLCQPSTFYMLSVINTRTSQREACVLIVRQICSLTKPCAFLCSFDKRWTWTFSFWLLDLCFGPSWWQKKTVPWPSINVPTRQLNIPTNQQAELLWSYSLHTGPHAIQVSNKVPVILVNISRWYCLEISSLGSSYQNVSLK